MPPRSLVACGGIAIGRASGDLHDRPGLFLHMPSAEELRAPLLNGDSLEAGAGYRSDGDGQPVCSPAPSLPDGELLAHVLEPEEAEEGRAPCHGCSTSGGVRASGVQATTPCACMAAGRRHRAAASSWCHFLAVGQPSLQ